MREYKIDPELNEVLPELSDTDYKALEQSLLTDGFKGAPIMIWGDTIVDGHNRYEICKRHDIPYEVKGIEFESKEEAMRWMVRQQIGRRTLTPLQRIQIVERYKPFYKKKAKENQSKAGKNYGIGNKKLLEDSPTAIKGSEEPPTAIKLLEDSTTAIPPMEKIDVREKLAKDADVSTNTYSKGVKILESGDKELINETINGQKSINKAYNELKENQKKSVEKDGEDADNELQNLKEVQRKEASQKIKEAREQYGIDSPEYEEAKEDQLNVEVQINKLEDTAHNCDAPSVSNTTESPLIQIKKRYSAYLIAFQQDIEWLSKMEFYQNEEEITDKAHSSLQNCLEKLKSINDMMCGMAIDEFGSIVINKQSE